jgi:carbon storage regulator
MLVMKRRAGETILIGDDIRIHIAEMGRTRVKLAIEAPRHVAVVAQEVKLTREENAAAASSPAEQLRALVLRLPQSLQNSPQPPALYADEESRPDPTGNR